MEEQDKHKSFIFYKDWLKLTDSLNDQTRLAVYDAIVHYALKNETPADPLTATLTVLIRSAIDRDAEKWKKTRAARSESGKRSGLARSAARQNAVDAAARAEADTMIEKTSPRTAEAANASEPANASEAANASPSMPPAVGDVREYFRSKGYRSDPDKFFSYFQACGWRTSKRRITDWPSAADYWEASHEIYESPTHTKSSSYETKPYDRHDRHRGVDSAAVRPEDYTLPF